MTLEWLVTLTLLQGLSAIIGFLTGIWLLIERLIDHAVYRNAHPVRFTNIRYGFSQRSVTFRLVVAFWVLTMAFYQLTFIAASMRLWFNLDRILGATIIMILCSVFNVIDITRMGPTRENFGLRYVNDVREAAKAALTGKESPKND